MSGLAHAGFKFDNSYLKLPAVFFQKINPSPAEDPQLAALNKPLCRSLGLDAEVLQSQGASYLAGNALIQDSEPIAQAYAGHQFGGFNVLGDGRATLLGEHITPNQQRLDVQLKGSGRTPYSRAGDGRAALGPMLREYLISEAMHALGIPTTRSLAVAKTGETVFRDDAYPGAVLTRIAKSHIRVGTFQFANAIGDHDALVRLADYTIERHFPDCRDTTNRYANLLERVIQLQAALIAKWMHVGFIHGVMNTDNMSICGETIDYGPCAFMNAYDPATVFSSIDRQGRYAYANQPAIGHWNLYRFAETLLPLLDSNQTQAINIAESLLDQFPALYQANWLQGMRKKMGLYNEEAEDMKLAEDLLMYLQKNQADFTQTFRALGKEAIKQMPIYADGGFRNWLVQWHSRLSRQEASIDQSLALMDRTNPAVIPRNHLVEEALEAAVDHDDMAPFEALLKAVSTPFQADALPPEYTQGPNALFDRHYKTFCGT